MKNKLERKGSSLLQEEHNTENIYILSRGEITPGNIEGGGINPPAYFLLQVECFSSVHRKMFMPSLLMQLLLFLFKVKVKAKK